MPTINQLPPATAVTDTDAVLVSQGLFTRRVTRAQLLAGLQQQISVGQGQLLGRASTGNGPPETLSLGNNLSLSGMVLSANVAPLSVPNLPAGGVLSASDLIPVAQGGRNVAVSYAQFLSGLASVGRVDVSVATVSAMGTGVSRRLADVIGDTVMIEAFGAHGDGISDDTAAFAAAISAGVPLRLGAKTYVINGQLTIAASNVVVTGVPGRTVLKRGAQAGNGAWISIQGDGFRADGVVFDANGAAVPVESWAVLVTQSCARSDFHRCEFRGAYGSSLGCGLVFLTSDPVVTEHVVRDCTFRNNAAHGLWVQACDGVLVSDCRAHDNGQYGIVVDFNDASLSRQTRLCQIVANRAWGNIRGISVGNFNATNGQPPLWGNADPDAISILVSDNVCHDNAYYGIASAGRSLAILGNVLSGNGGGIVGGAGVLANVDASLISGNTIVGGATFGIDCGGSQRLAVRGNSVTGGLYGINCGGGQMIVVDGNDIREFSVAGVCVANVEADASGRNFNLASTQTVISGNWMGIDGSSAGVWLRDGPQQVHISHNHFVGSSDIGNCLWLDTDNAVTEGNRYNFSDQVALSLVGGQQQQIIIPDVVGKVTLAGSGGTVSSMITARQAQQMGTVSFIRVTQGGSGYTHATVSVGGTGSGASATALLSGGAIIGVQIVSAGHGFGGPNTVVPVVISGDGHGAMAVGFCGPPLSESRRVQLRCDVAVTFQANTMMRNWTNGDVQVPAGADIDWAVVAGAWRGGLRTTANILSAPIRLTAPGEPAGCTSSLGRGSPEGTVSAAPGSDWRNLDGGVGTTWYVKRTGTGPSGWLAIA